MRYGGRAGADYDDLAESVSGTLYFAGEATFHAAQGTVHGAYESGQIAARECLHSVL